MNIPSKESINQLTSNGIFSLIEEEKKDIIVQLLALEKIGDIQPLTFRGFISDGNAKHKVMLTKAAAAILDTSRATSYCIIRIKEFLIQRSDQLTQKILIVITKLDIIILNINETIGVPMEYSQWIASGKPNKDDSNKIHPRFLLPNGANSNGDSKANVLSTNAQGIGSSRSSGNPGFSSRNMSKLKPPGNLNELKNTVNLTKENITEKGNKVYGKSQSFEDVPIESKTKLFRKQGSISYLDDDKIAEDDFMSIRKLSPYVSFVIKVRITFKSDLKKFRKDIGESSVFSADLIDKDGNEITVTFFGEAADHFHPKLEENTVYIMKGGNVKLVNSKFNKKTRNQYQIVYDMADNSFITKVKDDSGILTNKFNFVKIQSLEETQVNTLVDLAGFVYEIGPCTEVTIKKTNDTKERRVITLFDDSKTAVEMTLWGETAKNFDINKYDLIVVKGAMVSDFGGSKHVSGLFESKVISDVNQMPNDPFIEKLKEWKMEEYQEGQPLRSISKRSRKYKFYTIEEINNNINTITDKAFFDVTASITHIKTEGKELFYAGCDNVDQCARKAVAVSDTDFKCDACKRTFQSPVYRYNMTVQISDYTGNLWINLFDKIATTLIGCEANQMKVLKEIDQDRMSSTLEEALYKEYNFKVLVKKDVTETKTKTRLQAIGAEAVSYSKNSKDLLGCLEEYLNL